MATLTGRTIRSTYDQLLQLEDTLIQDGFGTHSLSGSYNLTGSQFISGNLHINGTASIDVLVSSYESSSIIYSSGSTKFGDDTSDTHEFTGSVTISGSAFSTNWSGSFTGSFIGLADSSSNAVRAVTSSQADRATTSSLANKASNLQVVGEDSSAAAHYVLFGPNTSGESDVNADGNLNYVPNTETLTVTKVIGNLEGTASNADTASVLLGSVVSASHCETASLAISTSVVNVTSTSFANSGDGPFTGSFSSSLPSLLSGSFTGSFTGSLVGNTSVSNLLQTGTTQTTGSNTISGSLTITGSSTLAVRVTGSTALTGSLLQSGSAALTGSLLQKGTIQVSGSTLLSGSLLITGSSTLALRVSGSTALTGSLLQSGSTALTGSLLQSGSIALTGSLLQIGTTQTTGSNIISGSLLITGSSAIGLRMSGSTALTGSVFQTGSLNITGSTNLSGSLTIVGNINTGQGATEVHLMNQDVETGDSVQFNGLGVGIAPSGVAGAILATNDVVAFASSDERLKENLEPIGSATEKIGQLTGYTFDWIPMPEIHVHSGHDVGIIAQEVEKVLPEIVEDRGNGYKAVKYEKLTVLLIQAVNEQQQQIVDLTTRINLLENSN
jgi:hypothetical protein